MERIAKETENRNGLEKKLKLEKKKKNEISAKRSQANKAVQLKEHEDEAKRRLDTEVRHQRDEAKTKALANAMLRDASSNKPAFNNSCVKLLNNFQGLKKYKLISRLAFLKHFNCIYFRII